MSKKEINVRIAAENAMAAGLKSAGASLKKFGQSAKRIAGFFAKGFLAAGAAITAFVGKSLSAYAEQEKAERSLIAAMNAHGEAGEALLPHLRRIADAIQAETGVADEATLAGMARMRMLGVQVDQMEKASKGVIALTRAGMGQEAAERAMAAALEGNVSMLTRYLPALRGVTDASEQQRIVNDFLARGYEAQKEELDTVAGRWNALKGAMGDTWEEFGRAISQNDLVVEALARAQGAVEKFRNMVVEWVDGGGVQNLIAGFHYFWAEVQHIWNMTSNAAVVAFSAIGDGAESAINYVVGIFKAWFESNVNAVMAMVDVFQSLWNAIRNPSREAFAELVESSKAAGTSIIDVYRDVGDSIINGYEVVTRRTNDALAQREQYHRQHADRVAAISESQQQALADHEKKRSEAAKAALEAEAALAESVSRSIIDRGREQTREKLNEIRTRLRAERDAGNDVLEVAKEIARGGREWAQTLTNDLMTEIDARIENEEEAAEMKRQIQEQLSADIHHIHQGLTELIRQEQMQRVENEQEAADEIVEISERAAEQVGRELEQGAMGADGGRAAGAAFNQAWNAEVNRVMQGLAGFGAAGQGMTMAQAFPDSLHARGLEQVVHELQNIRRDNQNLLRMG